ncbi:sensor histidine kinase [Flavisolibacter nicotianae]|uniref:sensor histidine kinase n=1 Tax=Flavisolibacter nicotianae TaxID=2364882 RepID=UPI000EB1A005|nr:ATP-binding protein [Flavisolibacter nicotianae]
MFLLKVDIENQVIIGISAMLLLFVSLLIAFISGQRRKLQYHQKLHALQAEQQELLRRQNSQLEQKVTERTMELSHQKEELQKSLSELKATQLQLIQREKMASLGELTAGIAHEIQNPLNFVNNFSDLSVDMLNEVKEEIKAGHPTTAMDLLDEATVNLKKISHHGKRADAIVKSMLEHSRKAEGEKEEVNINALTDEYLKLAYHGYRVKDNTFHTTLETHYDSAAGKINVLPQEIGRVLVNLFNNAFYAVHQKKKLAGNNYEPVVQVRTCKKGNKVEVSVRDNGLGIPEKALSKIYQPFFTTKPTGEGTGLGLSLSFDVVTKGHGGNLWVSSKEGEGAEFIMQLPAE